MNPGIKLEAASLASKYGFGDGDVVSHYLWDFHPHFWDDKDLDLHKVLECLVRTHLLPTLPGVEIYYQPTCHNTVRAEGPYVDQVSASDVTVHVTDEQILAAVAEVQKS